ncbi:Histone-lysine N-methyltransferase SMYD3 [Apiospora arundinis]|uniref:Histone-lysine N-methyltransferase SMYD3 n=1 Tax=Apiospora arundinis TaxID=335852 RepID=A0ABR2IF18_9PEZI
MSRHIPIRPVCARPGCVETKLGLNCYVCHLVRYCSQDCLDQDKPAHQSLCEQHENRARIFSYDVTKDIKELEPEDPRDPYPHCNNETPAIGDEPRLFSKNKVMSLISSQDQDGFKDGEEVNIAIYGFGDLGLLIETFLSIRHDTKVKYTFYMEEADNEAAARVFVLLAMAVNGSHYIQVAEAIIHYWYSAFLPDWVINFLKEKIHPNAINTHRTSLELAATVDNGVGRVQAEMMYTNASTTKGSQVWFTKDFGPGESLLSFTQPLDFLTLDHARLQRSHNINGRASSIQMELVRDQAHPGWRSSRMEHLKTGILLPLTASKAEFKNPNPSFFREWDKSKDYGFNPMEAWEGVYKPDRKYNVPFGDGHGNFFYFMREKLIRFLYAMDHMENWKIIVAPPLVAEGLPSSWNIQWHPEPKGKPIVELHKFNNIEEFRDFQKRHSLDRKQDQNPSSQGTEVEALADGHSGKAAEATQEEQSSPQELQPEKKPSDEKRFTKSEKRKAAIAKKKALKAAKSAAKADKKKNSKPSDGDGPTTQASAPANDATLGSSKATEPESPGVVTASSSSEVIFTPPASPGVSEMIGLSPHRRHDVTSPREDGEEQEQQEQEPGREGVGSSPTTALQDQLAVPLLKATEDEGSAVSLLKEAGSAGSAVFLPKATEDEGIELPPKTDSEPSVAVPDQTSSKPQPRRAFSNASHPNTLIFLPPKSTTSSLIADIDGNSLTAEVMSRNLPQNARRRTSSAPLYGDRNPWDIRDEDRRRVSTSSDKKRLGRAESEADIVQIPQSTEQPALPPHPEPLNPTDLGLSPDPPVLYGASSGGEAPGNDEGATGSAGLPSH